MAFVIKFIFCTFEYMKKIYSFLFVSVCIVLFQACTGTYMPATVNTPLMLDKGEFQASVHGASSGFNFQLAYAPKDRWGIMLNGNFLNTANDTNQVYHKNSIGEIGLGKIKPLGNKGALLETYIGFGYGTLQSDFGDSISWYPRQSIHSWRVFFQPSFGKRYNAVDLAFTPRIAMIRMQQRNESSTRFLLEPTFTGKFGHKYVKGVIQLGLSLSTNQPAIRVDKDYGIISVGVQLFLGRKFEEKAQK
jgi:hypothetical protein